MKTYEIKIVLNETKLNALKALGFKFDKITEIEKEEKQYDYPIIMFSEDTKNIIEYTGLREGTILYAGNKYAIKGLKSRNFIRHTSDALEPYEPVCDGKLNGCYIKASEEALRTLKLLGYKSSLNTNLGIVNYYYCVDNSIEGYAGIEWCTDCKHMILEDGKFIDKSKPVISKEQADTIYNIIKHGDDEHKKWLKDKLNELAND